MRNRMNGGDDRSDRVAFLFEECVEISDPDRRGAFLDAACAGCPELREKVETLLRAHEASGRFLNGGTPPMGAASEEKGGGEGAEFEVGSRVGPYRLIGLIGEGSTSKVFAAEQEEPVRRWVALKIVKPGMDSRNVLLRFSLERQALALMDHPGIAKLLDAGATSSGRPFFAMELVSGLRISSFCDEHGLTLPERLELFIQACNAVLHAHQRGIIHRDLKPDNILVSACDGHTELKIVDFGIAKVLHSWGQEDVTRTGVVPFIGTPAYMSPEQVQMASPELDTRTDIYSLGVVLYELLIGQPPFDHKALMEVGIEEMCRIIRTVDPVAPSERFARLSPSEQAEVAAARGTTPGDLRKMLVGDLDWIALKALDKSRDRRYATTAGLAEDITRHFEHLPVSAAAPSRRYRLSKLLRRNRKLVTAAGLTGSLILVSALLVTFMAVNAQSNADRARRMEAAAVEAEKQSHRSMVAMHISSGLAATDDNYFDRAVLWFANAARLAGRDDAQSEVNARRALGWMSRVSLPIGAFKHPSTLQLLEFSRDSRYLLALDRDRGWSLWDSTTQDTVPWSKEVGVIEAAAWSPLGSSLALVLRDGEVRVYEVEDGVLLHSFPVSPVPTTVGFSPDARYLVYGDSALHVFDLHGGSLSRETPRLSRGFVGLAFSAQPARVVGVTDDFRARVFDFGGETDPMPAEARSFPHRYAIRTDVCTSKTNYREGFLEAASLSLPALAPGGDRLLTRTGTYEVTFWDLSSGEPVFSVDQVCCSCRFVTSPEAGLVACGLQGGKVGLWEMATAAPYQLLPSHGACILDIAFGMDGRRLITAETNGMARLWSVDEGREVQSPLHHSTDVDKVAISRNGLLVATAQSDGLVRVWNVVEMDSDEHVPVKGDLPTVVQMDSGGCHFVLTREPSWKPGLDACIRQVMVRSSDPGEPGGATIRFDACVAAAAFSPDSKKLAVGVASAEAGGPGRVEIHEVGGSGKRVGEMALPAGAAALSWNPISGDLAVICLSGELIIIQPEPDVVVRWRVPVASVQSRINPMTAFTADGTSLVSLGLDGKIEVREATTGRLRYPALEAGPDGYWSFALSGKSSLMATSTINGDVAIWRLENGEMAGPVLRHPGWVYRCRFSAGEDSLVTAAHDGRVRLWDWRAGKLVADPMVHPSEIYDAVFTPDDRWVLTACRDGCVRIWEPVSGQIVAPPVKVGQQAFNIEISGNGHQAVVGSWGSEVYILSLEFIHAELAYDPDDLCLLGEVVSSCTVQGGSLRDLTTSEWLDRYARLRNLHPEIFGAGPSHGLEAEAVLKSEIWVGPHGVSSGKTVPVTECLPETAGAVGCVGDSCGDCPEFAARSE